jgi:hypothetical protein
MMAFMAQKVMSVTSMPNLATLDLRKEVGAVEQHLRSITHANWKARSICT